MEKHVPFLIGVLMSGSFCYYNVVGIFCQPLHKGRMVTLNMFFHSYNSIKLMAHAINPFLHLVTRARILGPKESLWHNLDNALHV